MTTVAPPQPLSSHGSRGSPAPGDMTSPAAPPPPSNAPAKKTKAKKGANDANDAARQLQAKIAQLELDQQGRTEEDAEIGRSRHTEEGKSRRAIEAGLTKIPYRSRGQESEPGSAELALVYGSIYQQGRRFAEEIL